MSKQTMIETVLCMAIIKNVVRIVAINDMYGCTYINSIWFNR